jgi:hypothetical protein
MYGAFAAFPVDFEQAIVAATGLGNHGSRCLSDSISDGLLRELMVATITNPLAGRGPPSAVDRNFERILEQCSRQDDDR